MQKEIELFIQGALAEDIGDGDHSSLACIQNRQWVQRNYW